MSKFGERSHLIKSLMRKAGITFDPASHVISGDILRETGLLRAQFEGSAKSGKSRMMLDVIRHMHEVMGFELDEIMMCVIDFDKDGIQKLLESNVLPRKYHQCLRYWKLDLSGYPMLEAYAALDHFEDLMFKHHKDTGVMPVCAVENVGAAWTEAQNSYCKIVYGRTMVELMMESKVEAERQSKKTLPALDQLHDYKIINQRFASSRALT